MLLRRIRAWVLLLLSVASSQLWAVEVGHLRARFREHLEWSDIKYGVLGEKATYFGSSNTINVWFERPFDYSIGFAFGPAFGAYYNRGRVPVGTESSVKLYNIGLEGKYFFLQHKPDYRGTFGRVGIAGAILDAGGTVGVSGGFGYSVALGYEYKYWKVGIAPEVSFRHVFLDGGSRILALGVSVGLHFYIFSDDTLRMEI